MTESAPLVGHCDCIDLWILLGEAGRYICVQVEPELPLQSYSSNLLCSGFSSFPPGIVDGGSFGSLQDKLYSPNRKAKYVTLSQVSALLRAVLAVKSDGAFASDEGRQHRGHTRALPAAAPPDGDAMDESVEVDEIAVQLDFFDITQTCFADLDCEVDSSSRLILFCNPASAETTLAAAFSSHPRPSKEPVAAEEETVSVANNRMAALQAVKRVADRTLRRYRELTATFDDALREAQKKVDTLKRYREANSLLSSQDGSSAKRKDKQANYLKAGVKVASEALGKALQARDAARDIFERQRDRLTAIALDAGVTFHTPDVDESCAWPNAAADAVGANQAGLAPRPVCLSQPLATLRDCLNDVERVADLLEQSNAAVEMADTIYNDLQHTMPELAAAAKAQQLLRRRQVLERAVAAVLEPLLKAREQLESERAQFSSSDDFSLLSPEQKVLLSEPLPPFSAEAGVRSTRGSVNGAEVGQLLRECGISLERHVDPAANSTNQA